MNELFLFPSARRRHPDVEAWFSLTDPLRVMAQVWFDRAKACGKDVQELLHDGYPVACVGEAVFVYVNAFKAHANIGFYCGAMLPDPAGLLEGEGKRMRHVKLRPGHKLDEAALQNLIRAAYADMRQRLGHQPEKDPSTGTAPMKTSTSAATKAKATASPSALIDGRIKELGDWRGETLAKIRKIIHAADPAVVEEWKWRGVPIWEHDGIICTGETYKDYVKTTFAKGAALPDPTGLFNAGLDGGTRRAIDFRKGDKIDEKALKALIQAAVALNTAKRAAPAKKASAKAPAKKAPAKKAKA
jgi:hypothetical protein